MYLDPKNISVVIQGVVNKKETRSCIASVRKFLPGAEIILSTWKNQKVSGLDYDVLIESEDPGAFAYRKNGDLNNLNRQLFSTSEGVKRVNRKFTLKLRTDLVLTSNSFLNFFDKFNSYEQEYRLFEKRVLASSLFSRESIIENGDNHKFPLAPSDWWFFGLTNDIRTLFDISLVDEPEFSMYFKDAKDFCWRLSPEQYIGNNLLKSNREWYDYQLTDTYTYKFESIEFSKHFLTNNFTFLGFNESGIYLNKYMPYAKDERLLDASQYNGLITHYRFLKNYKRYCDSDYQISSNIVEYYNKYNFELDEISFVIQGQLNIDIYKKNIENIRKYFPGAEVVLSTYSGTEIDCLDYDYVVLTKDPGCFPYNNKKDSKLNNVNRQIITTLEGLKKTTRKYVFKLRSDFIVSGTNFLEYFDKFLSFDSDYKIFEKKILVPSFFSRNPRVKDYSLPFHPSDIAFFGLRSDVMKLFNIPLMLESEAEYFIYKGEKHCRYVPEQYIWVNCLREAGKNIKFDYQLECNDNIAEETERYFSSNFVYLDYKQLSLVPPKKLTLYCENDFKSVVTYIEWQHMYKKYVDSSHIVPKQDLLRDEINKYSRLVGICSRLVKYLVLVIPSSSLRKKLRQDITKKLTKGFYI